MIGTDGVTRIVLPSSGKIGRLSEVIGARAPGPDVSLADQRRLFEEVTARLPLAEGVRCRPVDAGGVPAEWIEPPHCRRAAPIVMYFHGGGYIMGSLNTIRALASRLSDAAGARLLSVGYRLAPEHPLPAAVDDGVAAYRYLLSLGTAPSHIVLGGDSAGGGLTVAVLMAIRDRGLPQPAGAICLSPWSDLTLSGSSIDTHEDTDPEVRRWRLTQMAELYLDGQDPRSPLASPALADLTGVAPLLVVAGTAEVLQDDAVALGAAARRAGVDATVELYQDMIHVWPAFAPGLPEATATIDRLAAWINEQCKEQP
ncbi:MAG: alpha/beta hydrolase [Actinomycetota bacterium]|jgi:epsilon-lactone hydrolase